MISRSLQVPGSDSSALTTRYDGRAGSAFGMNDHFSPVGKPAPPRPRRPEAFISAMIQSLPLSISAFVLSHAPRARAPSRPQAPKPQRLVQLGSFAAGL